MFLINEINKKSVTLTGLFLVIFCAITYNITNHYYLFTPHYLPETIIDKNIPFLPSTIWIYMTEIPLCISAAYLCRNVVCFNRYVYALILIQTINSIFFVVWPTIYPREHFPLPVGLDSLTANLFNWVRNVDLPTNCFPSCHVSMAYLSAFVFLKEAGKKFWFFFTWATLIMLSTLTTKQHYIFDVIAALIFTCTLYWILTVFMFKSEH